MDHFKKVYKMLTSIALCGIIQRKQSLQNVWDHQCINDEY